MERYEFVENKHKVAVGDRIRRYCNLAADVWDYLEQAGFQFHGVVRDWSAVFYHGLYYAIHHFVEETPPEYCIAPDSWIAWYHIFRRDSIPGSLFSFLEDIGFRLFVPEQAFVDAA